MQVFEGTIENALYFNSIFARGLKDKDYLCYINTNAELAV